MLKTSSNFYGCFEIVHYVKCNVNEATKILNLQFVMEIPHRLEMSWFYEVELGLKSTL